jgi:hypothetical protein
VPLSRERVNSRLDRHPQRATRQHLDAAPQPALVDLR